MKDKNKNKLQYLPDPKIHQAISFIKSGGRLVSCVLLGSNLILPAAIGFGISEILGIIEEIF
jgi:hypothetical protein